MSKFKVKRICKNCGRKFLIYKCRLIEHGKAIKRGSCCCERCSREYRKRLRVILYCEICGKKINTSKSRINGKHGNKKYCSWKCNNKSKQRRKIIICLNCGKKKEVRKSAHRKFCCFDCFHMYNKGKNHHCFGKIKKEHWKKFKCQICGKIKLRRLCDIVRRMVCSRKCYKKFRSIHYELQNHPNWLGGKSFEPYGLDFNKKIKELVRNRDNRKCQICEIPEIECDKNLTIHHIDYNKKNSEPKNLISLCNSCHTKTNYKRKYWIKYFTNLIQEKLNARKNTVSRVNQGS